MIMAMTNVPFRAVIFDFDGVMVDTEPLHHEAFCEVLRAHGLDWTWEEYVETFIGFDDRDGIREAFRLAGRPLPDETLKALIQEKAKVFIGLASRGVEPYPGLLSLLQHWHTRVPLALCSGALRSDIDPILKQLKLESVFDVITTADDVEVSKPDPASYRLTVERLAADYVEGLKPGECLAIEDTPAGIQSAKGAGITTWAVAHTQPASALTDADRVVAKLSELWPLVQEANEAK